MEKEEMKLMELGSGQMLSEKFWRHEYVIDRIFLMRAPIDQLTRVAQVSMRYRAEDAKLRAQMLELESNKFAELSKIIG